MDDDHARLTYTVSEAGRKLGVSRGVAYEAAARGELPTIRLGRRLLVPRAALDRLLGGATHETPMTGQASAAIAVPS